jgi:hypothetical protein
VPSKCTPAQNKVCSNPQDNHYYHSLDDVFVVDVDVGGVGAYAFNGAINKNIAAAVPTINIFCLFNLLNLSPFH